MDKGFFRDDTAQLVDQIAKSLVDNPQQVLVTMVNGENTTVLELKVAKEDLGKVIGKQGRTAQAMRTLLSAISSKSRKHMVLEIVE
ncbi:MAG: KH domain-containing protein [Desulfobacteraceae bacterium]|nr:KH domain-containing protein [Desulfobacteraceae bacterium]